MNKRVFYSAFVASSVIALGLVLFASRWWIHDYVRLRGYTPSEQISAISRDVGFSEYGERIFYVQDPAVLTADSFNGACSDTNHGGIDGGEEAGNDSIILGCYDGVGIYIYDVVDDRLNGIEEVTAAHEMLHAAYARLAEGEKQEVNEWLSVTKESITNPRILSVIDSYSDLDKEARFNELHSIIGTEVSGVPAFLEDYYGKYFIDRSRVIAISQEYEQVFTEIKAQLSDYDERLVALSLRIRGVESGLTQELINIEQRKAQLPALLEQERIEEYNALVGVLRTDIAAYNSSVARAGELVEEYNQLVAERNELGDEQNNLVQSIDSRYEKVSE